MSVATCGIGCSATTNVCYLHGYPAYRFAHAGYMLWTSSLCCAKLSNKAQPREVSMTITRSLTAILAAAFAFAAGSARAEMKNEWVEYSHGNTKLKAYMAYDDKATGKRPAVFVVHAREGMTPKTQQLTETWAKLGYVAFATDIFGYGQGVLPKDVP